MKLDGGTIAALVTAGAALFGFLLSWWQSVGRSREHTRLGQLLDMRTKIPNELPASVRESMDAEIVRLSTRLFPGSPARVKVLARSAVTFLDRLTEANQRLILRMSRAIVRARLWLNYLGAAMFLIVGLGALLQGGPGTTALFIVGASMGAGTLLNAIVQSVKARAVAADRETAAAAIANASAVPKSAEG